MSNTADVTTLVSLFHTHERAAEALRDLQAAGIPQSAIQTLGGNTGGSAAPEQSLASLQALNLPSSDAQMISEGLKSGGSLLIVRTEHGMAEKAETVLEKYHANQIDERTVGQPQVQAKAAAVATGDTISVVEEQLVVGQRKVQSGGVRVFSRIVETPVEQQVTLQEEHAHIERHAVNRPVSSAEMDAFQNQTIEIREMGEEAVVGKTARVVEEVSLGKETTERTQQIHDTVRKTQVEVDELNGAQVTNAQQKTRS